MRKIEQVRNGIHFLSHDTKKLGNKNHIRRSSNAFLITISYIQCPHRLEQSIVNCGEFAVLVSIRTPTIIMGAKSGIQKEVLALYRTLLREASKKDRMPAATPGLTRTTAETSSSSEVETPFFSLLFDESAKYSTSHVRYEFRRQASQVNRKDFRAIEYKIRHGYKQIKLLKMPGVVNFRSW